MVVRTIESRSVGRIWDELLSRLQAAWPEESLNWDQTPLELVTRLVNERDVVRSNDRSHLAVYPSVMRRELRPGMVSQVQTGIRASEAGNQPGRVEERP